MRRKWIAALVLTGVVLVAGWYVFALNGLPEVPPDIPNVTPNSVLTSDLVNEVINQINALKALAVEQLDGVPEILLVNCDAGETITEALHHADHGDTIQISGTCGEAGDPDNEGPSGIPDGIPDDRMIHVVQDGIVIDGQGTAILDGGGGFVPPQNVGFSEGVITVDGVRELLIKGLTVQNGPDGIVCRRGASCVVDNVTAKKNAGNGFRASANASARFTDCTAEDNGNDGFAVSGSASATFRGTITSMGNADDGINVRFSSSGSVQEATVVANSNGNSVTFGTRMFDGLIIGDGIRVSDASNFFVSGNSVIETMNNANDGISVSRTSTFATLADPARGPVTITSQANGALSGSDGDGVHVGDVSFFTVNGTQATLIVSSNAGSGVNVFGNARATCPQATVTSTLNVLANSTSSDNNFCANPS